MFSSSSTWKSNVNIVKGNVLEKTLIKAIEDYAGKHLTGIIITHKGYIGKWNRLNNCDMDPCERNILYYAWCRRWDTGLRLLRTETDGNRARNTIHHDIRKGNILIM
jgi:hypothetical protein